MEQMGMQFGMQHLGLGEGGDTSLPTEHDPEKCDPLVQSNLDSVLALAVFKCFGTQANTPLELKPRVIAASQQGQAAALTAAEERTLDRQYQHYLKRIARATPKVKCSREQVYAWLKSVLLAGGAQPGATDKVVFTWARGGSSRAGYEMPSMCGNADFALTPDGSTVRCTTMDQSNIDAKLRVVHPLTGTPVRRIALVARRHLAQRLHESYACSKCTQLIAAAVWDCESGLTPLSIQQLAQFLPLKFATTTGESSTSIAHRSACS
jgi:hypothetical protein